MRFRYAGGLGGDGFVSSSLGSVRALSGRCFLDRRRKSNLSVTYFVGNTKLVLWMCAIWYCYARLAYGAIGLGFAVSVSRLGGD